MCVFPVVCLNVLCVLCVLRFVCSAFGVCFVVCWVLCVFCGGVCVCFV